MEKIFRIIFFEDLKEFDARRKNISTFIQDLIVELFFNCFSASYGVKTLAEVVAVSSSLSYIHALTDKSTRTTHTHIHTQTHTSMLSQSNTNTLIHSISLSLSPLSPSFSVFLFFIQWYLRKSFSLKNLRLKFPHVVLKNSKLFLLFIITSF